MIDVIILAAGKGTRMKTDKPKALVEVKGKTLLKYVIDMVSGLVSKPHVIVGHKGEDIIKMFGEKIVPIWQKEMKGTAHAVMAAKEVLDKTKAKHVVVLFADQPLIKIDSIRALILAREKTGAVFSMATVCPEHHNDDYSGFKNMGRIVRDKDGMIQAIVEYKNATDDTRALKEVNISTYCFDPKWLWENIGRISKNDLTGEYYITDLVSIARAQGKSVTPLILPTKEGIGANTQDELLIVERLA